jgi:glycosyltransferase involved in cell wall biosynthesis
MLKIRRPKLSVIIPVFNERRTVEEVVRKIKDLPVEKEIIVIDDYSTDGSRELLKKLQPELKLKLILHSENRGKGSGVRNGAAHAKGEYIVIEDADSELDSDDILKMLELVETDPGLDMVIGIRDFSSPKIGFPTHLARFIASKMIRLLFGARISDPLCAYKLCRLSKFQGLRLESSRFGIETEWLIKSIKKQWKISEIPVKYSPRGKKEGKKIALKDGFDIIIEILKLKFLAK